MHARSILGLAVLCGCTAAIAQQPGTKAPEHAVPISQEHHHHLIIENRYTRAYEVEVPAHDATLMHEHDHDYAYVVLGDSDVTNTVAGKAPVKMHLPDGTVNFSKGPFAHIAANDADTPFRNITIVLLRPQGQGQLKTFHPSVSAALEHGAGEVPIMETNEMLIYAVGIAPNGSWSPKENGHHRLLVLLDKMQDDSAPREPKAPRFPAGMLRWIAAGSGLTLRNTEAAEMKLLVVEFEDSARQLTM
ncbi:MAG TPA: hypothetical protein VN862_11595 [Candidatus Acidoferrales bacterium]|nr:hypothetical protein [Candidatus Acidoferrales bacterium]